MSNITIYTANLCSYCLMAKKMFERKGVLYTEINIDKAAGARDEMMKKSQRRSVPQIFIGDTHVGGCDDLYALERAKKLDTLLAESQ
ncbi:MAG: glutaredoxin 3 [Methylococcales bacterium]|nr:glutaredoxin 3 [Methylococcales bacterium]